MKVNTVEKYFKQKNWSLVEIICVVIAVIFAIVATFIDGGGPIGLPLVGLSVIILIICRSTKISDTEIDALLNKLIDDNIDTCESKYVIKAFDLRNCPGTKGKDGKIRSTNYVISCFLFECCETQIVVYRFNLLSNSMQKETYAIPKNEKISLIEESVQIGGIKRTIQYIECKTASLIVPVNSNEMDSFKIIEKLCSNEKR